MSSQEWTIEFYETEGGEVPVKEFLDNLPDSAQAKFVFLMDLLEKYGLELREPYVKSLKGVEKLKEIRLKSKGNAYRVFYFAYTGRRFIMLHGFTKKTQKTPVKEIKVAKKRMEDHLERHLT